MYISTYLNFIIMIVIYDVLMFQYKIVLTNMNIDIVRGVNANVYIYNIIVVMTTVFISSYAITVYYRCSV